MAQFEGKPPRMIPVQSSSSSKQNAASAIQRTLFLSSIRIVAFLIVHPESRAGHRTRRAAKPTAPAVTVASTRPQRIAPKRATGGSRERLTGSEHQVIVPVLLIAQSAKNITAAGDGQSYEDWRNVLRSLRIGEMAHTLPPRKLEVNKTVPRNRALRIGNSEWRTGKTRTPPASKAPGGVPV
jgi:hypothetical protein